MKWQPVDQIMLRGTYSKGFRAPSFAENGSSSSEGFITFAPPNGGINFINAHHGDGYTQPYALALLSSANPTCSPRPRAASPEAACSARSATTPSRPLSITTTSRNGT